MEAAIVQAKRVFLEFLDENVHHIPDEHKKGKKENLLNLGISVDFCTTAEFPVRDIDRLFGNPNVTSVTTSSTSASGKETVQVANEPSPNVNRENGPAATTSPQNRCQRAPKLGNLSAESIENSLVMHGIIPNPEHKKIPRENIVNSTSTSVDQDPNKLSTKATGNQPLARKAAASVLQNWRGQKGNHEAHKSTTCPGVEIDCPQAGCYCRFLRMNLDYHLENECEYSKTAANKKAKEMVGGEK